MQFNSRVLLQVKLNSSKMFRHEEKLTLVPVKTFLKNSANIITAFKTGFTVCDFMQIMQNFHSSPKNGPASYQVSQSHLEPLHPIFWFFGQSMRVYARYTKFSFFGHNGPHKPVKACQFVTL